MIAKLTPPTLPAVVERRRLYRLLDRARERPIIWIAGLPGAGKTTLVASYVRNRRLPCVWYQVNEGDADIATFFHYLGLACQKAAPRYRRPMPRLTPEYAFGLPTFTRRFFEEFYRRNQAPAVTVFDNYHEVPADAPFHDVVQVGLSGIPPGTSVIVISREDPPPAFARLHASRMIAQVEPDALRLTEEEARAISRLHVRTSHRPLTRCMLDRIQRKANGWVAGLVLLLEQAKAPERPSSLASASTPEVVFAYLAREALMQTSHELQSFLLRTAFLPSMTVAMARDLTGLPAAGHLLGELYRGRHFTERRQEAEVVYQYHPLYREFLVEHAKEMFSGEQVRSIQRKAAALLERWGRISEAVGLYQETGQTDEVVRLVCEHAPAFLAQGRARTVEMWITSLPRAVWESNPWLLCWLAQCRLPTAPAEAKLSFEGAHALFEERDDRLGRLLSATGAIEAIFFAGVDLRTMDPWLDELDALLGAAPAFPNAEMEGRAYFALLLGLCWRRPEETRGAAVYEHLVEVLPRVADKAQRVYIASWILANYTIWFGHQLQASTLLGLIREWSKGEDNPILAAHHYSAEAVYAWNAGDGRRCLDAVRKGVALARQAGLYLVGHALAGQGVCGALLVGDVATADELLKVVPPGADTTVGVMAEYYHGHAAWLALVKGDKGAAWRHLERELPSISTGGPYSEAHTHLGAAHVLFERGDREAAARHLSAGRQIAHRCRFPQLTFLARLTEAYFALARGDDQDARQALAEGLAFGRAHGLMATYFWRPDVMARLCTYAMEHGIEMDYVRHLVHAHHLALGVRPLHLEEWPWAIKVYSLGRFRVRVDDRPVHSSRKVQKRPFELLKALVSAGGQDVPASRLSDAFWPDAEGDAGRDALAKTVQRLRKLLGHDDAVRFREGRVALDPTRCWVDAWAFDDLVQRAEAAARRGDREESLRLGQRALQLYEGSFLPADLELTVTHDRRERLRHKYVGQIVAVAAEWERRGQPDKALEDLKRAVDVEPLAEPLYHRLIEVLVRRGQRAEAQAVYERCRKTLAAALDLEPSPELAALLSKAHVIT